MNLDVFKASTSQQRPPAELSIFLQSLWYDAKGNWKKAHELVQDESGKDAAWVHAYLHRCEGDVWNADYWYRKAGRKSPSATLAEEWQQLVTSFLAT